MIATINIEMNKSEKASILFLKSNKVVMERNMLFGNTIQHVAIWKNLENPKNFKFTLDSFGPISPWWGKCSLKTVEPNGKTILTVTILPPLLFLFFHGAIMLSILYTIISIGIHNYGTDGFLPSIIIPTILIGGMLLIWRFIARSNAKKIKEDILASFEE